MTKTEIAKTKDNNLFTLDKAAQAKMSKDSNTYVDDTNAEDITIPRLRILQSASDEVKKSSPESYIEGAEEGDLFDTLNKKVFKSENGGVLFVPSKRTIVYLEWKSVEDGGGLIQNFGEDSTKFLEADVEENGRRISENGNEIIKTHDIYGYVVDIAKGSATEIVISMAKTQAKKAKNWNAIIRQLRDPITGQQLPEYAGVYEITTVPESNDKGSWFSFNIKSAGFTLAIPKIGDKLYDSAKSFADILSKSSVKVDSYEGEADCGKAESRI